MRDLRTSATGLTGREAARRLVACGPNELKRSSGRRWPRELAQQLVHPLALLLAAAAVLAWVSGTPRCRSSPSTWAPTPCPPWP